MKRLVMILLVGLFCLSNVSYAGNGDLTVGGTLDMTGNANGFLPPRMTTAARGSLSPSPGMLIFNTDDNAYNYYTSGGGWKAVATSLPVHDNTGSSSDYALAVGETAKIVYVNITNIPLHIAVSEGEYEITIHSDIDNTISTDSLAFLRPNNTQYNDQFRTWSLLSTINPSAASGGVAPIGYGTTGSAVDITDSFIFGTTSNQIVKAYISTFTKSKTVLSNSVGKNYQSSMVQIRPRSDYGMWDNASTPWTSLGTVIFPVPQSGTIITRRIF